ncbi:MAG: GIY-YIG nuclease family protein [Phormidesmis sp.]
MCQLTVGQAKMKKIENIEDSELLLERIVSKALSKEVKKKARKDQKPPKKIPDILGMPPRSYSIGGSGDMGYIDYRDAKVWLLKRGYFIAKPSEMPIYEGGVYVVCTETLGVLYVGQSAGIRSRVLDRKHPYKVCFSSTNSRPILFIKKTADRLYEECLLIGCLRPKWNFGNAPVGSFDQEGLGLPTAD